MSTFMLKFIKAIIKYVVINFYSVSLNTSSSKKALLSYIVHPYLKSDKSHPNVLELNLIVETLISKGYSVKIVDYRRKKLTGNYDLCIGFGDAFEFCLKNSLAKKSILYSTGSPSLYQNEQSVMSFKRYLHRDNSVRDVYPNKYLRFTEGFWPLQLIKSDAIVTIGNDYIAGLFRKYNVVYRLPSICFHEINGIDIIRSRDYGKSKYKFIWFGGKGIIHKGLDLCIDAFKGVDAELYIAGNISDEIEIFKNELSKCNNIKYVGFLDVKSKDFRDLLLTCSFVILPSCSEGMATSIITLGLNGGIVPIVTKECGFDFNENCMKINSLTVESVRESILHAISLPEDVIIKMSYGIVSDFGKAHTKNQFILKLNDALNNLGC